MRTIVVIQYVAFYALTIAWPVVPKASALGQKLKHF